MTSDSGPSSNVDTTIIGVGRGAAGDDGVGLAVIEALRGVASASIRLESVSDPTGIVPLLEGAARVVIVDAVVDDGAVGTVHSVRADALDASALDRTSTHGLGVGGVLRLAEAMSLVRLEQVHVVAIAIGHPEGPRFGLSAPVTAAVGEAVRVVLGLSTVAAAAPGLP